MKALIAALATSVALGAAAQMPMKPDFERGLGVSAETAAKVEAVIAKEREAHLALHEKTRADLAKFLTPEQMAKFDAAHPKRGEGPGPGMGYGPHHGMMGQGMGPARGPGMGYGPGMRGAARGECPMWDGKPEAKPAA